MDVTEARLSRHTIYIYFAAVSKNSELCIFLDVNDLLLAQFLP
jgi:hypothetical protein